MAVCHNTEPAEGWTNQDYLSDQHYLSTPVSCAEGILVAACPVTGHMYSPQHKNHNSF